MSDVEPRTIWLELGASPPSRLDKALAAVAPEGLSRSRLTALIRDGQVCDENGAAVTDPKQKTEAGAVFCVKMPAATPVDAAPEDIPLEIVYEDDDIVVVNKPAGMVVHPAPGAWSGTLVNALLHHCGDSLSGVGGEKRPGIVHRIDKDTSGLLVVAKTDTAHQGLAVQFADHSIERLYDAVVWGVPSAADPRLSGMSSVAFEAGGTARITARLARHVHDRKKMAVTAHGGRHAVTRATVQQRFGTMAALLSCQLETGRTHQIRVHLTHVGHPLVGDPVYGRGRTIPASIAPGNRAVIAGFRRQALHARVLGFMHPTRHELLQFEADMPEDMRDLCDALSGSQGRDAV